MEVTFLLSSRTASGRLGHKCSRSSARWLSALALLLLWLPLLLAQLQLKRLTVTKEFGAVAG